MGCRRAGFSSCGVQASVLVTRRLSSCGARAQLLRGMWDLPGPGLEPVSPALAGGFLTMRHQGSPFLASSPPSPQPLNTLSPPRTPQTISPTLMILSTFCLLGASSLYLQPMSLCNSRWHNSSLEIWGLSELSTQCLSETWPVRLHRHRGSWPRHPVSCSGAGLGIILEPCLSLMSRIRSVHRSFWFCLQNICRYLMMLRNYGYFFFFFF